MSVIHASDAFMATQVLDLVLSERRKALSPREWKHRLAGYGYSLAQSDEGVVVTSLRTGTPVCAVPGEITI
ncbi:MAG: hypothetical protein LPK02_15590 [Rhodobacterales bacterium]|nr:hypothetical protein [Rhodobacterales bacterium]MDX5414458.1 hypothetical protein [Rhodobacterales bacterium]